MLPRMSEIATGLSGFRCNARSVFAIAIETTKSSQMPKRNRTRLVALRRRIATRFTAVGMPNFCQTYVNKFKVRATENALNDSIKNKKRLGATQVGKPSARSGSRDRNNRAAPVDIETIAKTRRSDFMNASKCLKASPNLFTPALAKFRTVWAKMGASYSRG